MTNVFEFVKSINYGKKNIMEGSDNDELVEKSYIPFIVNKSMSYFPDSILYAQEMNLSSHIDNKLQYDYLFNGVPKRNRFAKWHKKTKDENLQLIAEHYNISLVKADEICSIISKKQVDNIIKRITSTGGM